MQPEKYLRYDSPIYNLQFFLRTISKKDSSIPSVVPDGIYGEETRNAVLLFQRKHSFPETGVTDLQTWKKVVVEYKEVMKEETIAATINIFPIGGLNAENGSYSPTILIIQTMIKIISDRFTNIKAPSATGYLDSETIESVKALQLVFGINPDGNITKEFWNHLVVLYEQFVTFNL